MRRKQKIDYAADKARQEQEELKDRSQARKITRALAGRRAPDREAIIRKLRSQYKEP